MLYKAFPGGFLALAGAGSPDNLARRPVKRVFCDETDKYPITREGDPIGLADERMATYVGSLSVRACSPTIEGESLIESSYLEGDQRQASVACPECGHRNFLEFFKHLNWDKDYDDDGNVTAHYPRTAQVLCEACGCGWSEGQRLTALGTIRWHQTKRYRCCGKHVDPLSAYAEGWKADPAADAVALTWDWWECPRHAVYRARCPDCGTWPVSKAPAFNFNSPKRFDIFSAQTAAGTGIASVVFEPPFASAPAKALPSAIPNVLAGPIRAEIVAGSVTKAGCQVKVTQQALVTGLVTALVGATVNVIAIEA